MERTITIDGKQVPFKATGSSLRRYRFKFGQDMLQDFADLVAEVQAVQAANMAAGKGSELTLQSLTPKTLQTFEQMAYIFAKQADDTIPDDPDEWLDEFSVFSIYVVLPEIIELWQLSNLPTAEQKKKQE